VTSRCSSEIFEALYDATDTNNCFPSERARLINCSITTADGGHFITLIPFPLLTVAGVVSMPSSLASLRNILEQLCSWFSNGIVAKWTPSPSLSLLYPRLLIHIQRDKGEVVLKAENGEW